MVGARWSRESVLLTARFVSKHRRGCHVGHGLRGL
ncbi:hypothetical protein RESH_05342 [Rhodopirellula europaea SH398]|uniref:Uncharacterized protein n=1 Tax=Rhodopirellula europaea SH398 TaxID=1263868 RepID=M5RXJ4_9BACT|nr:hypothetical protein RESH_05342 [Rhodopirellula europaea SH398]